METSPCPRCGYQEPGYSLPLNEGERQMVLMALAKLCLERPGWDDALSQIAARIDNPLGAPGCMYEDFIRLRIT